MSKAGFKHTRQNNVELHVADTTNLVIKMEVGATSETVSVEATPLQVNTENGEVSNIMNGTQVRELPMNGRNFVQLTTLVPGASIGESFDSKNKGLFSGVDISFSGAPSVNNQWTVDGAGNNDIGSQRTILVYPSIDGIDEFKIQRNSYGPEYGGASGAQINIITKGGGSQYHGDVYYFGRNDVMNAKDFFLGECTAGGVACKKNMLRRNDYGYTFGGPIKKDKVFFFWSQEWNHEIRGRVPHHCVPTAAERTGDFSNPACGPFPVDPETGLPFPGNIIPASRLSPAGQAYLATMPLPNLAIPSNGENWVAQVKIPVNFREEHLRGDWNITKNTSLMIRYTQDAWANFLHANEAAGLWGDSDYPALSDTWNQPGKSAVAKISTTISSSMVNDFQFSWSGNRINITRAGDTPALNDQLNAVMPRLFPFTDKLHGSDVPTPVCWCGEPSGLLGIISPWQNRQDLFAWKDDFSKVSGNHTFKAGFLYSRNAKDEEVGDEGGEYWGGGNANSAAIDYAGPGWTSPNYCGGGWGAGCDIGTGNTYANYLLRGMTYGYDEVQKDGFALVRWRDYEFYGGDTWKVSRRVTLTYGARWSLLRAPYLDDNKLAGFLPSAFNPAFGSDPCNGIVLAAGAPNDCPLLGSAITPPYFENHSLVKSNNHMITPRLGVAWDVFGTGKLSVRMGIGQFYSRDRLLGISMRSSNSPFGIGTGAVRTLDGPMNAPMASFAGNDPGNQAICVTTGCVFGASLGGSPHQGLDPNPNQANSWQWNLTVETAVLKNSKLEVGWVANRGIHLQNAYDANQIPVANRLQAAQLAVTQNSTTFLRPYPFNSGAQITMWSHTGDNIYHSLQAMFSSKFQNNSMFQLAYTWSKNLGDTTFGYVGTGTVFADNSNTRINRGPVDFDRRHVLSATLVYNVPELKNSNALMHQVLGGWETNTIVQYASGPALTIQGNNGLGEASGTGTSGQFTGRPLRVYSEPCHVSGGDKLQWLNPKAFTWDGYKLGTFSNSGPGQCAGPPVGNMDFSINKNWHVPFIGHLLAEKARLQFRLEMFNVFNHPQFRFNGANLSYNVSGTQPVDALGANCFALPSSCVAIQGGTLSDPNFGKSRFLSQSGNREIQYGLKLIF